MTSGQLVRLAGAAFAVGCVVFSLLMVAAVALSDAPFLDDSVFVLAGIAPTLVGALLLVHRPGNRVGLVLIVIGSCWALSEAARLYLWMSVHIGPLPATEFPTWFLIWVGAPIWMLIPVLVAIFPTGGTDRRVLGVLVRLVLVALSAFVISSMFAAGSLESLGAYLSEFENPLGFLDLSPEMIAVIEVLLMLPFVLLVIAALIDVVLRWRRSYGVERLQMRWFAFGVLVMVLLLLSSAVMYRTGFGSKGLENLTTTLAISAPPLAIGVAVARYRLYDIDRIISRALGYALVTACLAGLYLGLVVGLQAVLRPLNQGSDLSIALTTLVVAALFLPVRRRIQEVVDRRFNRRAYDAARTMDEFGARLRQQVDLDTLRYELLSVVDETMEPVKATLWLRGPR